MRLPHTARLIFAVYAVAAADTSGLPLAADTDSSSTAVCRSGREFAIALANPSVALITIPVDITVHDEDWGGGLPSPVQVARNVAVVGGAEEWPLLDFNYVKHKVQMLPGVTISLRGLVTDGMRAMAMSVAPGVDLLLPSPPPTATASSSPSSPLLSGNSSAGGGVNGSANSGGLNGGQPAVFELRDGLRIGRACYPPAFRVDAGVSGRPAFLPGRNSLIPTKPQPGCVNSSSARPQNRCWADRGRFLDVALESFDVSNANGDRPVPQNYVVRAIDLDFACREVISQDCIRTYGVVGCLMYVARTLTQPAQPPRPEDASLAPETMAVELTAAPGAEGASAGSGRSSSSASRSSSLLEILVPAVVGGVGGALVLAGSGLVVFRVLRRRRRRLQMGDGASKERSEQHHLHPQQHQHSEAAGQCQGTMTAQCGSLPESKATASSSLSPDSGTGSSGAALPAKCLTGQVTSDMSSSLNGTTGGLRLPPPTAEGEGEGEGVAAPGTDDGELSGPQRRRTFRDVEADSERAGPGHKDSSAGATPPASSVQSEGTVAVSALSPPSIDLVVPCPPSTDPALGPGCSEAVTLEGVTLGKGIYGRVMLGTYMGQRVAVKLIGARSGGCAVLSPDEDKYMRCMQQEVEVLGRCRHANVVQLLAANLMPPQPCLVMELMETSLGRLINQQRQADVWMPLDKVLHIALGIASGLEFLHPTIVHRDLKPANVLLRGAESDRPVAKLADFGISRLLVSTRDTKTPEAGTPPYMAPECFDAFNYTITHKVDMYSFGVLLAELVSGKPPWPDLDILKIAYNVTLRQLRPQLLEGLPPERCPAQLHKLILGCWDADPLRRPAAAEAVKVLMLVQQQLAADRHGGTEGMAADRRGGAVKAGGCSAAATAAKGNGV